MLIKQGMLTHRLNSGVLYEDFPYAVYRGLYELIIYLYIEKKKSISL